MLSHRRNQRSAPWHGIILEAGILDRETANGFFAGHEKIDNRRLRNALVHEVFSTLAQIAKSQEKREKANALPPT